MEKEYWHKKWENGEIRFNQAEPNALLVKHFPSLKLKPGARVFVPFCGKSIDMLWLAEQGYFVLGVEVSLIACEAFFEENKLARHVTKTGPFTLFRSEKITLFSGDFFDLSPEILGKVDAVFDRAALVALPEDLRRRYGAALLEHLNPGSVLFFISLSYDQQEMTGPPFSVRESEVRRLYGAFCDIEILCRQEMSIPPHWQVKSVEETVFKITRV